MITKTLTSGKDIIILDNLFSAIDCITFEKYAMLSLYSLKGSTTSRESSRSGDELFFGADLDQEDINRFGIFNTREFLNINPIFENRVVDRAWILCTSPSTKYLYHADDPNSTSFTLLFYLNGFWHPEWGGETLFCDDKGEPEFVVSCKPNRAVIFPSNVLHKPSETSRDSRLRFTFTARFIKNED